MVWYGPIPKEVSGQSSQLWRDLFSERHPDGARLMMTSDELREFDQLKSSFTIYRGVYGPDGPGSDSVGISWTLDRQIAERYAGGCEWFPGRHAGESESIRVFLALGVKRSGGRVIEKAVSKDQCLCLMGPVWKEIIVSPKALGY